MSENRALTGRIKSISKFTSESLGGRYAYKIAVESRDPSRPKVPILNYAVIMPRIAKRLEKLIEQGVDLVGMKCRLEGSTVCDWFYNPDTGKAAPTPNLFVKEYEVFDHLSRERTAGGGATLPIGRVDFFGKGGEK